MHGSTTLAVGSPRYDVSSAAAIQLALEGLGSELAILEAGLA
jgi:hypothetical protein